MFNPFGSSARFGGKKTNKQLKNRAKNKNLTNQATVRVKKPGKRFFEKLIPYSNYKTKKGHILPISNRNHVMSPYESSLKEIGHVNPDGKCICCKNSEF